MERGIVGVHAGEEGFGGGGAGFGVGVAAEEEHVAGHGYVADRYRVLVFGVIVGSCAGEDGCSGLFMRVPICEGSQPSVPLVPRKRGST